MVADLAACSVGALDGQAWNLLRKYWFFADWYEPGYQAGGPIRSVVNIVGKLPFEFYVITSDRDHNSSSPYEEIPVNQWTKRKQGEQVIYLDPQHQNKTFISQLIKEVDPEVMYLNSLFSPKFAILPLMINRRLKKKVVLAPRGMLKSGALSKKAFKKRVFLFLSKTLGLYEHIVWHATNSTEKEEILSFRPQAKVRIAANIASTMEGASLTSNKQKDILKLVAISRVSQEKNIHGGIEILRTMENDGGEIVWDIYGTLENEEYLNACKSAIQDLKHVKINFKGEIPHYDIPQTLREYDFLFLPTLGENYGHAIVESFMNGLPVIISDKTPWTNLALEHVGWDLSLGSEKWPQVLRTCIEMEEGEHRTLCENALNKGNSIANDPEVIRSNKDLFLI